MVIFIGNIYDYIDTNTNRGPKSINSYHSIQSAIRRVTTQSGRKTTQPPA